MLAAVEEDAAVDTDAKAVWAWLNDEERKTIKCLQLQSGGAEKAQRLSRRAYGQYTGEEGEQDKMPEYHGSKEPVDDLAIRTGLDKILLEYLERESYAEAMLKKYDDVNEAYIAIENYDALKRSNVATAMTLDYRIWRITEADRRQAEIDYEATQKSLSPDEFSRMYNNG